MQFMSYFVLAILCSSFGTAFAKSTPLLVETDWLFSNLKKKDLVLVDARPKKEYLAGHIEGAVNIPVNLTYKKDKSVHLVASVDEIKLLIQNAGIGKKSDVVIYDEVKSYKFSARVFWILKFFGIRNISILNGSLKKWQFEKKPLVKTISKVTPTKFIPRFKPKYYASRKLVSSSIKNPNTTILDSRKPEEYNGAKSKASRKGHIPSAENYHISHLFNKENGYLVFKTKDEIKTFYKDLYHSKKLVAYCNTGKTSAVTFFSLLMLKRDIAVYDGAWIDWANDSELPIAK